jgi:hypothetical protein
MLRSCYVIENYGNGCNESACTLCWLYHNLPEVINPMHEFGIDRNSGISIQFCSPEDN